ncbi:MAG: hypothetical protein QJR03_02040 [Sphaerobacter sp.]|nr:hypothetical protein [Sphaerobacter sp.]
MKQPRLSLSRFYEGWDVYQQLLAAAVAPLRLSNSRSARRTPCGR